MTVPRALALPVLVALVLVGPASAPADVVLSRLPEHHVLTVRDGAAPMIVTRNGRDPSWSADRATLAYATRAGRVVVERGGRRTTVTIRSGGARRPLTDVQALVLAPGGDRLLVSDYGRWRSVDLATGTVRHVTSDDLADPRFSPDGRTVAWAAVNPGSGAYVRPVDRKAKARRLPFTEVWSTAWLGGEVAVLHGEFGAQRVSIVDPATGAVRPLPVDPPADATILGATFGGRLLTIATVTESRDIGAVFVVDMSGRVIRVLRDTTSEDLAFTQDGAAIYHLRGRDLILADLATGAGRKLAGKIDYIGTSAL